MDFYGTGTGTGLQAKSFSVFILQVVAWSTQSEKYYNKTNVNWLKSLFSTLLHSEAVEVNDEQPKITAPMGKGFMQILNLLGQRVWLNKGTANL